MVLNNSFSRFKLSQEIIEALTLLQLTEPTRIQEMVIPNALEGQDIVGKSKTGTGKTAAFAIPICEKIAWEQNSPQALILEPTRELTVQVQTELVHIGRKKRLKVPALFGGMPMDKQALSLKQKAHMIVGTPGRVLDHLRRGNLDVTNIKHLVIDEADLMLNMGFLEEVKQILDQLPEKRQTMLFSATMNDTMEGLIHEYMADPISVTIESGTGAVTKITQQCCYVENEEKYQKFLTLLIQENPEDCMIFCATREMVNTLYHKLLREKIRCGMLHGEMEQKERLRVIEQFREGYFHYLVCTDVAARGIDFEQITHVFHYDFPMGRETYVHRTGRTGRNGKEGKTISLVTAREERMKQSVEEYMGQVIETILCPDRKDLEEKEFWQRQKDKIVPKQRKGSVFYKTITRLSIGGGKKSKIRAVDIVGTICSIEGILAEDIGIIDIRDSLTYVEILNNKGKIVCEALQDRTIKGKVRKVRITKGKA